MTRNEFRDLVPPPPSPPLSPVDWDAVIERLGTQLPSDYRWFADVYGAGTFGGWRIAHPDHPLPGFNLWDRIKVQSEAFAFMRTPDGDQESDEDFAASFAEPFPAAGGVLAFADTDTGDGAFWLTGGDPDEWPIYTDDRGSDVRVTLDLTTLDWLAALARGDDPILDQGPVQWAPAPLEYPESP